MKNEHKIDTIPMHDDRDLTKQSFGNIALALERGSGPLERPLPAEPKMFFLDILFLRYFLCFWGRLIHVY